MSGQSFPQDVVAGTQLVVPSIHSPNYLAGTSGWTINLDGSAEFNNLTIRGTFSGTNFIINSSGAFFYSPSEGLGNLIVSIASAAGTDSFGNAYPMGINVTTGTISGATISGNTISGGTISGTTVSGSTISGSTISGTTFDGTDFILNSSGAFFYSGAPGTGNLVASISQFSGTDSFGNSYLAGFATYSGSQAAVITGSELDLYTSTTAQSGSIRPSVLVANASFPGELKMFSGQTGSAADNQAIIQTYSSGNTDPSRQFSGQTEIDLTAAQVYATGSFSLNAGNGPFVIGESFHTISGAAGLSGTFRVKLLPWNAVWFDGEGTFTYSASSQTFTMGSFPGASYYPTGARHLDVALTGAAGNFNTPPRLFIPTSGGPQLIVPSGSGSASVGWSVMFPNN